MKPMSRKAVYLGLCLASVSCKKADDDEDTKVSEVLAETLSLSAGLEKARGAVGKAVVPNAATLRLKNSSLNLLACDSSVKGGLADCWTEAGWFVNLANKEPENDKVYGSVLASYSGNMLLSCFAQAGVDAKSADTDKDEKGYPKNGSYSFKASDLRKADLEKACGISPEAWDEALEQGVGEIEFTAEVTDTSDTSLYDKKLVFTVADEVSTKIELLLRYNVEKVSFLMRQSYKNGCCGGDADVYNSGDRVLFDYDITEGVARYEYLSPLPFGWTNSAGIGWQRLLIDEKNDEAYLAFESGSSTSSVLAYTSAFKFDGPESIAFSVSGSAQEDNGDGGNNNSGSSFNFSAPKSGCIKPDLSGVVTGKDASVTCELSAELVDSAAFTAIFADVKTVAFTASNASTLLPASETVGVGFSKSDVFTRTLQKN